MGELSFSGRKSIDKKLKFIPEIDEEIFENKEDPVILKQDKETKEDSPKDKKKKRSKKCLIEVIPPEDLTQVPDKLSLDTKLMDENIKLKSKQNKKALILEKVQKEIKPDVEIQSVEAQIGKAMDEDEKIMQHLSNGITKKNKKKQKRQNTDSESIDKASEESKLTPEIIDKLIEQVESKINEKKNQKTPITRKDEEKEILDSSEISV